jgi:hypothetical protein
VATYSYNDTYTNCTHIYRTTGGGVTFSANLVGATFDYFTDTAVNNDAIYFSSQVYNAASNLKINVGTALVGGTGVWEYSADITGGWRAIPYITDPSNGFTVTGAHTIVFPVAPRGYAQVINGLTRTWVRFRLTGGTVTEGGANQTTTPSIADGRVTVSGGTDASPGTFKDMYDWVVANVPEASVAQVGSDTFIFDNVVPNIASRLKTTNQKIFIGCQCWVSTNFSYLESGTKVGTDGWMNPSHFFFALRAGGDIIVTTPNMKIYGGTWGPRTVTLDGVACSNGCYLGTGYGEVIGLSVDDKGGYFVTTDSYNKNTHWGQIISTSFPSSYPQNMRISNPSGYIIGLYSNGGTITGLNYALPTTAVFTANQKFAGTQKLYFRDPSPPLPAQGSTAPYSFSHTVGPFTNNLAKVFYYDSTAGTYTDYTTAASNDTANDVPLSGEVGDYYYFGYNATTNYQFPLSFTLTDQSNDYEYVWEYYDSSWKTLTGFWDLTENFTKSGVVYIGHNTLSLLTVSGTSSYWYRMKITKKGTASPTFTMVKTGLWTAVGDWRVYEQFGMTVNCIDENEDPIENASILFTDGDGGETTVLTDSTGVTAKTYLTTSTLQFDPISVATYYKVLKTSQNPYIITASKPGYQNESAEMTLSEPNGHQVFKLKKLKSELKMSRYMK